MKFLFLHPNFPAQFVHLARYLGHLPQHQVAFITQRENGTIPSVRKLLYHPVREAAPATHHYTQNIENAVLHAQAAFRTAESLLKEGWIPDVIYGHSGWGPLMFMKDLFPQARVVGFFEWFYRAFGSDADFDPQDPLSMDSVVKMRIKNTPILVDLYSCDAGVCPTYWQRDQFPPEFHRKLRVLHDGIDTETFAPQANTPLILPEIGLDLSDAPEIVTYVARGMEPYRGFPQFMEAVAQLQTRRPGCHVVVVGQDRVAYGKPLPHGKSYKTALLEKFDYDLNRVHFTGQLALPSYLKVLQASTVHVYLTRPFVLSWSFLEAMSTGCLVVASRTAPVEEVIVDGHNGLLVDFFDTDALAHRIESGLDHPNHMETLRLNARKTIERHYALSRLLPDQLNWLVHGK